MVIKSIFQYDRLIAAVDVFEVSTLIVQTISRPSVWYIFV